MTLADLLAPTLARGARWSVRLRDVATGAVLAEHEPDLLLRTASVGKVFLLVAVAEQLDDGRLDAWQPVDRRSVLPVADSGLWQHLATDVLPLEDVVRLVGSVSDNWATNALLEVVGLEAVRAVSDRLAPGGSVLHDHVRDVRRPEHPPTLSEGSASDWASVMAGLDARVLAWLAAGTDLSMVAGAFGLDPLAHAEADRGVRVWSKTGTSEGVRADVALVDLAGWRASYAVLAGWPQHGEDLRDEVLATMRGIGDLLRVRCP